MSEPASPRDKIFLDGLLTAVAVLPDADLEPLTAALEADTPNGEPALDRPALAVAVAECGTRLEGGFETLPFDAGSTASARQWLAGFFRGVSLYPSQWQAVTGTRPDSAYALLVLAALLDPETGGNLPGAADAVGRLADDPALVPGMVRNIYRDLRTPLPGDPTA